MCQKQEKSSRLLSVKGEKQAFMMAWGCITVHDMNHLHMHDGIVDAEAYIRIRDIISFQNAGIQ